MTKFWHLLCMNILFWTLDMTIAITGFTLGFGLTVQNWPALIGFMIGGRYVAYVIRGTVVTHMEKKP